ncbi:MAG: phage terminase small subunit P27 family [Thalassobaculum sp.]|uniref:phage terminase small subunit P27 family n=1 Tax=Thalassobaculum sp. TaxID=2022740 RepID=UPI0032F08F4B
MKKPTVKTAEIRALRHGMPSTSGGLAVGTPSAPSHLSTEAKSWWRKVVTEYEISDDTGLLLLQTALESFDRMRSAQRVIKREGQSIRDRFGFPRAHPLLTVERDSRAGMLAALKQMNLDLEPLNDRPGRPGGSR